MIPKTRARTRGANKSGVVRLDGTGVRYTLRDRGSVVISLDEVGVIGEYTTENGPLVDDWFLVLVCKEGTGWFEISMYAEGIPELFRQLSAALGAIIEMGLANKTDFSSHIIWPPSIAGRPLFHFTPVAARSVFHWLKLAIIPEIRRRLTPDALAVMPGREGSR
jgi:hypothetical protein